MKPNNIVKTLLKGDYSYLPQSVQIFHEHPERNWLGEATAKGGNSFILKALRFCLRLPPPLGKSSVKVNIQTNRSESIWIRTFGKFQFQSAIGCHKDLMYERFGPLRFHFKLQLKEDVLHWDLIYITFVNLRIPKWHGIAVIAQEYDVQNNYCFKAYVKLPLLGILLDYEGYLKSES